MSLQVKDFKDFEEQLNFLQSICRSCTPPVDWQRVGGRPEPTAPVLSDRFERQASVKAEETLREMKAQLETQLGSGRGDAALELAKKQQREYQPGLLDKVFGRQAGKEKRFQEAVVSAEKELQQELEALQEALQPTEVQNQQEIKQAKEQDHATFEQAKVEYQQAAEEHIEYTTLANRMVRLQFGALGGEAEDYLEVIEVLEPLHMLHGVGVLGETAEIWEIDSRALEVKILVLGPEIVPEKEISLTKTGKVSEEDMTKSKFFGIYQDYVSGSALRVARELFSILPVVEQILINVATPRVNTKTGHEEDCYILSLKIQRTTLENLNFKLLDPSDAIGNFEHEVEFLKTRGYQEIPKLLDVDQMTEHELIPANQRPHLLIDFTDTQQLKDVDKGNRNLKNIFRSFRLERLDQLISSTGGLKSHGNYSVS